MELYIDHLVIITGPTSSGKSTLIKSLAAGKLDDDTRRIFPEDISSWPSVPAMKYITSEYAKKMNATRENPLPGMVLHYDFLRPFKKILNGYHEDNIDFMINRSNRITVYIIKPEPEVLLSQLTRGELGGKKLDRQPAGVTIRKLITQMFSKIPQNIRKSVKKILLFNRKSSITDFNKLLYFKYQEQGWVDGWYEKFNAYLNEKASSGKQVDRHFVKPSASNDHSWKVIR